MTSIKQVPQKSTENRMGVAIDTLSVRIPAELKELIGKAADAEGLALNEYVAKVFAQEVSRPDLRSIPRGRPGRKRQRVAG